MTKYGDEAPSRERRSKRKDRKKEAKKDDTPEAATLLEPSRRSLDGEANAEPSAATSSPLLVRADGDKEIGLQSDSPKRKPNRKPRLQSATSALRLSRSRPQRQESDAVVRSEKKDSAAAHERASNERDRWSRRASTQPSLCGMSSVWAFLTKSACVRGSLRLPMTATELSPVSADARAKIQSLNTATAKSHVNISILHTDNVPLGSSGSSSRSRGRPVVITHLVDVCSGRPIEQQHPSPPAAVSTLALDELEWNSSHTWSSTALKEFLSPHVLVLIEIVRPTRPKTLSTPSLNTPRQKIPPLQGAQGKSSDRDHDFSDPAHFKRLAWCFFKPVSDSGNIRLAPISLPDTQSSTNTTQRLQLFAWQQMSWLDLNQARTEYHWDPANANGVPTVFLQYQKRIRVPLSCSLHVDIRPVASALASLTPQRLGGIDEQASDRSLMGEGASAGAPPDEALHQDNNQVHKSHPNLPPRDTEPVTPSIHDPLLKCKRQIGEPCIVPQRVLHRLPTGRRGCSCLAFSPDGLFLAAAVHHVSATTEEWVIHIHQVNTGVLWQSCRGHQTIIYSLEWGLLGDGVTKGLVSASSDSAALLWLLRETQPELPTQGSLVTLAYQIFQHVPAPVFVYCAIFHASQPHLIVTGSSDGLLRLWDVNPVTPSPPIPATSYSSTPQLQWKVSTEDGVAIHSIRMEAKQNGRLFCGDSQGNITVWTPTPGPAGSPSSYELMKTVRTGQRSVTSLYLHPRKQHLLVLTHPHALLQYELRSFLLLHKNYTGIECDELLVQAAFSPDGQFVVSGSEDGVPHLFHSVSGHRLDATRGVWGQRFFHGFPLMEIAWSPSAHVVAMAAYGENHPIVVLCAHQDDVVSGSGFQTAIPDGQGSMSGDFQRKHRSSSDVEGDVKSTDGSARARPRAAAAAAVVTGKLNYNQNQAENPEVVADRVQRALQRRQQRRQQRLEAKLAREAAEAHALHDAAL